MNRPGTLAELAHRRKNGEDLSILLREFLDEFYGAVKLGDAAALIAETVPKTMDKCLSRV